MRQASCFWYCFGRSPLAPSSLPYLDLAGGTGSGRHDSTRFADRLVPDRARRSKRARRARAHAATDCNVATGLENSAPARWMPAHRLILPIRTVLRRLWRQRCTVMLEIFQLLLARSTNLHAEATCADGRDLLGLALDGGNPEIIKTVVERLPPMPQWKTSTRRALNAALQAGNKDQIRSLLGKHATPPTPEGKKRAVSCVFHRGKQLLAF